MILRRMLAGAALAAMMATGQVRAAGPIPAAPPTAAGKARDASLDDYRQHLTALSALVEACAKARDTKACDPALVGPDERVPLGDAASAERRLVRYGWLRTLFAKAGEKDKPEPASKTGGGKGARGEESTQPAPRTTPELLEDAEVRLARDLAQADAAGKTPAAAATHTPERDTMRQVLAGRDFRGLKDPTVRDSAMERLGNWLNKLFEGAARLRSRSAWIGRVIVWGFILAVCVGLIWGLLQLERRWRIRLVPENEGPATQAASARDWQLYLEDAHRTAAAGEWRQALHFVYWAAISRLESKRLWPADRARTPREYLALVAQDDPRRAGLASLTGSFERTWYGGRAAGESDYRQAEELAAELISGSGTAIRAGGRGQ
jgi:hypothetical protein